MNSCFTKQYGNMLESTNIIIETSNEQDFAEQIAEYIKEHTWKKVITVMYNTTYIVGVTVYFRQLGYFIFTISNFEKNTFNICEYYNGITTIK